MIFRKPPKPIFDLFLTYFDFSGILGPQAGTVHHKTFSRVSTRQICPNRGPRESHEHCLYKWPFWKHLALKMPLVEAQCAHWKHCYPETLLGSHPTARVSQSRQTRAMKKPRKGNEQKRHKQREVFWSNHSIFAANTPAPTPAPHPTNPWDFLRSVCVFLGGGGSFPCPSFPCFFGIPCFFSLQDIPCFLSVFPFFSRDIRGSVRIKNPCFFWWFSLPFFSKKTRKGRTGFGVGGHHSCNFALARNFRASTPLSQRTLPY